jgi:hypothetical protein
MWIIQQFNAKKCWVLTEHFFMNISTKFLFKNKEGIVEEIPLEKWAWAVVYKDNTELHQFELKDGEGIFHQIGEVVQENVALFVLLNVESGQRIDIIVPEGAKLIHKYKNYFLNVGTPEERRERVYVLGYKLGDHFHFNYVMPNGTIIQSTKEGEQLSNYGL